MQSNLLKFKLTWTDWQRCNNSYNRHYKGVPHYIHDKMSIHLECSLSSILISISISLHAHVYDHLFFSWHYILTSPGHASKHQNDLLLKIYPWKISQDMSSCFTCFILVFVLFKFYHLLATVCPCNKCNILSQAWNFYNENYLYSLFSV